jgi:hypothetical protein
MTYTQGVGELWIKKALSLGCKTIHRFPPRLDGLYTGGFRPIKPFQIINIAYFYMKSGPTITTKLLIYTQI